MVYILNHLCNTKDRSNKSKRVQWCVNCIYLVRLCCGQIARYGNMGSMGFWCKLILLWALPLQHLAFEAPLHNCIILEGQKVLVTCKSSFVGTGVPTPIKIISYSLHFIEIFVINETVPSLLWTVISLLISVFSYSHLQFKFYLFHSFNVFSRRSNRL